MKNGVLKTSYVAYLCYLVALQADTSLCLHSGSIQYCPQKAQLGSQARAGEKGGKAREAESTSDTHVDPYVILAPSQLHLIFIVLRRAAACRSERAI